MGKLTKSSISTKRRMAFDSMTPRISGSIFAFSAASAGPRARALLLQNVRAVSLCCTVAGAEEANLSDSAATKESLTEWLLKG